MNCQNCDWSWSIEPNDENPYLCHKCGYDSELGDFDMQSLKKWQDSNKKNIIGAFATLNFTTPKTEVNCKVDTGAETNSVHCTRAFIKNGKLYCELLGQSDLITFDDYTTKNVRSSNGLKNKRYCIKLQFNLGDKTFESDFTLNNRSKMKYPVLLGKNFLNDNNFIVDVVNDTMPFQEQVKNGYHIRTFSQNVENSELVWHRDREDRIVESVDKTDWLLQMDNEVPQVLEGKFFIPKNTYHRVIKGDGDLTVKVKKIIKENDLDWINDVPSDFDLDFYKFLDINFKTSVKTYRPYMDQEPVIIKYLVGMDESFNMTYDSKKRIFNRLFWLLEDDFQNLSKDIRRRTLRRFLNDKYQE